MKGAALYKCPVNARLASKEGTVMQLEAGTERMIPELLLAEALAVGCTPVSTPPVFEPVAEVLQSEIAPEIRIERIADAVRTLIARNDSGDFTKQNRPKKPAVRALLDFDFDMDELYEATEVVLVDNPNSVAEQE